MAQKTIDFENDILGPIGSLKSDLDELYDKEFAYKEIELTDVKDVSNGIIDNSVVGTTITFGSQSWYYHYYVETQKGEKFKISLLKNWTYSYHIVFTDDNGKVISRFQMGQGTAVTVNVEVETPEGATRLYLSSEGYRARCYKYTFNIYTKDETDERIEALSNEILSNLFFDVNLLEKSVIAEQLKNDFAWGVFDKVYVTISIDDSLPDISDFVQLFKEKNVPLCLSTIPSKLDNICNNGESVKKVCQECVNNGGEILTHWDGVITSETTYETMRKVIVGGAKTLTENGFEVNGIIMAGGENQDTADFETIVNLMRPYYRYSDRYGFGTGVTQYIHPRSFLGTNKNNNRNDVAIAITNFTNTGVGSWVSIATHGTKDLVENGSPTNSTDVSNAIDVMSDLLDFISTKPNAVITTFKGVFDSVGSTKLEQRIKALEN